jgi:hypothetical protein
MVRGKCHGANHRTITVSVEIIALIERLWPMVKGRDAVMVVILSTDGMNIGNPPALNIREDDPNPLCKGVGMTSVTTIALDPVQITVAGHIISNHRTRLALGGRGHLFQYQLAVPSIRGNPKSLKIYTLRMT